VRDESDNTMMLTLRSIMLRSLLVAGAFAGFGAADAHAASTSTNWSGYVAHGARFHSVSALWTQPTVTCTPGTHTYSAAWVGLGGYSLRSTALEQIGTEADCTASGKQVSSAWYELVPAPSRGLRMTVAPGDVMAGHVTVTGNEVALTLTDRTRHKTFTKKIIDHTVDITSADWILEAPSECTGDGFRCQPLTLANFGTETFAKAQAQTVSNQTGAIASSRWQTAEITLSPTSGGRFGGNAGLVEGQSVPGPLTSLGTAFSLAYTPMTPVAGQPQPAPPA
jgi:hypothetical protein